MQVNPDLGPAVSSTSKEPKEMLSAKRDAEGRLHFRINSSSLSILQTCSRKARYALKEGWSSNAPAPAVIFGSAVHKALEAFYSLSPEERVIPSKFEDRAEVMIASEETPEGPLFSAIRDFITAAEPLRALPGSDKRSLEAGIWSLTHYFKTYEKDPFVVLTDADGPVTERRLEAVLAEDELMRITYFGTVDVILRNRETGMIIPADHKTFSANPYDFYKRVKPNHQYSGYVWLVREALGLDVDTFLVNGIQVKPKPKTARGTPPVFPRQPTRRTAEDLTEFREAVIAAVRRFASEDTWPLGDVNACSMYNGCSFQRVCESPETIRINILENEFTKGPSCEIK